MSKAKGIYLEHPRSRRFVMDVFPIVVLTEEILAEVNEFTKLALTVKRIPEIDCFSDPRWGFHNCNPQALLKTGKPCSKCTPYRICENVCSIHHICHVYLGGRMGVGLSDGEDYDFKKAKDYCKTLSWKQLAQQIEMRLEASIESGETLPEEVAPEPEEISEAPAEQAKLTGVQVLPKQDAGPSLEPVQMTEQEAPKPKATKVEPSTWPYNPGAMGYVVLETCQEGATLADLEAKVKEKGWSRVTKVPKIVEECLEKGLLKQQGEQYFLT